MPPCGLIMSSPRSGHKMSSSREWFGALDVVELENIDPTSWALVRSGHHGGHQML